MSVEELRRQAAAEMRLNVDKYLPFFIVEGKESSDEAGFLQHCDKVESTAEWGDELEIQALSNKLKLKIVIYSVDLGEKVVGKEFEGEPLRVCFLQHAYQLGAHYNSVHIRN